MESIKVEASKPRYLPMYQLCDKPVLSILYPFPGPLPAMQDAAQMQ